MIVSQIGGADRFYNDGGDWEPELQEIYQKRRSYLLAVVSPEFEPPEIYNIKSYIYEPGEPIVTNKTYESDKLQHKPQNELRNELLTIDDYIYKDGKTISCSVEFVNDIIELANINTRRVLIIHMIWCRKYDLSKLII